MDANSSLTRSLLILLGHPGIDVGNVTDPGLVLALGVRVQVGDLGLPGVVLGPRKVVLGGGHISSILVSLIRSDKVSLIKHKSIWKAYYTDRQNYGIRGYGNAHFLILLIKLAN